jgi:hypothetical protein
MKLLKSRLLWVVVLALVQGNASTASHAAPQQRTAISVTRIYTGPDGQTHAERLDLCQGASANKTFPGNPPNRE